MFGNYTRHIHECIVYNKLFIYSYFLNEKGNQKSEIRKRDRGIQIITLIYVNIN